MLSDEERKAINNLNFIIVTDIYDNEVSIDKTKIINEYNESVGIVLDLIRKQSKEIEELKEDNKHQWEERCKLTFELENSTSNDKIKAKIEYKKDKLRQIQNFNDRYRIMCLQVEIDILQSLLEKE